MEVNPLKLIFKLNSNGECISQLDSIPHISKFFEYLESNSNGEESSPTFKEKSIVIKNFCNIIKENRTIIEFFSSYNEKSIYFYLFDIYLNPKSTEELRLSIILLLDELRLNIQTNKEIYSYLFNKLSLIYRGELGEEHFYKILFLINVILGDTINHLKPRNYFACNGQGKFIFDSDKNNKLELGFCLTFILNFKINLNLDNMESNLCNIVKIKLNNKTTIKINLKTPGLLMIKDKIVKIIPQNEWINLIINLVITDNEKLQLYFFVNGENNLRGINYEGIEVKNTDEITSLEFFDNFYGEVTSITLLSQKEEGYPGVHSNQFLLSFKHSKEGIWKRKLFEKFINEISKLKSKDSKKIKKTRTTKEMDNNFNLMRATTIKDFETERKLKSDLIFIFSSFNYIDTCPNIMEDCLGQYRAFYYGNITNHRYKCYQNKLNSVCNLTNLFPIAEMFLIYPKLLNEKNLEIFLKIIENVLNYRKSNIQLTKYCKFFKVLSLFIEKYPKNIYTEKILDSFANIGKTMFRNNSESLSKTYFKHILLNEKILSKYNSNLQIKFWNYIKLLCESDSSQIQKFINMNRISLLLRFYDRKKYYEICCKEHLDAFKEEFIKNKKIMNPPLNKKLSYIKDVLDVIIYSQTPNHSFYLFKLLTLDLSPCLVKFIINIFKKALEDIKSGREWKNGLIKELINNKYEIILINTFIHSLPDVRLDILELMYQIHIKAINQKQRENIENHELMLKPFLLPTHIFYIFPDGKSSNNVKSMNNGNEINIEESFNIKDDNEINLINKNKILLENNETRDIIIINDNKENKNKENYDIKENNKIIENKNGKLKENIEKDIIEKVDEKEKKELKEKDKEKEIKDMMIQNNIKEITQLNDKKSKNGLEMKGELIIKDEIYQNYIEKLFSYFLLWSLDIQIDIPYTTIHLQKSHIKDLNILQHLFEINLKIKNIKFETKLVNSINYLMELQQNCFKALYDKKFFSLLLDLSFNCYLKKETQSSYNYKYIELYNKTKDIIINTYINSLSYASNKAINKFPSTELETIYIWGDKILMNELDGNVKNNFHSFLDDILCELLTHFKVNFESKMEFSINNKNDITTGYFFNNYIIFISELYHYCFQYRLDTMIYKNGLKVLEDENKKEVSLPALFVYSMRITPNIIKKINEAWIDFKYIYEIYHRIKYIWQKNNLYKKYEKGKKKTNNKFKKYEQLVQNLIINKNVKNLYKKELEFLFYKFNYEKNIDFIVPVIKIIHIFMMCIISVYINRNDEKELISWLKEYKQFLRFIIISSSNLIMREQIEFYEKIQEHVLYAIIIGICFLRKSLTLAKVCKFEIEKILINIIILCLFIVKFQINYFISHKKKRIFGTTKFNRNDLSNCAVVILFNKYILDKKDQIIFNLEYIEQILTEKHYYDKIRHLLNASNSDLEIGLFRNQKIITLLNEKYFCLYSYKTIVDSRFKEIKKWKDEMNLNFSKNILNLLPLYEKELAKYSNNNLEKNLFKKNLYRKMKKNLFAWNGYWSDKSFFFLDIDNETINNNIKNKEKLNNRNENGQKIKIENVTEIINEEKIEHKKALKFKLLNHYTKSFMKPLLAPILDIKYYLPKFSCFDSEKLFKIKTKQIINLDIDQILKISDSQNPQENVELEKRNNDNNKIMKKKEEEGNYLRKIYIKSNPEVADELLKINNNLDFGKEEEEYIEEKTGLIKSIHIPKTFFLSCLVKASHHIKGVCFVDDQQLVFKVFLNQKTGKSMNGINLAFTETDEDYDPERKTCYGSYFMFHHKDKNLYKIAIKYNEIKWIFRRRYYYKNSALEIFTNKNKSFYFNFKYEKERELVLENILKKLKYYNKIIVDLKDPKDSFENVVGYQHNNINIDIRKSFFKKKVVCLSEKIESWKKWKISNFEFLMWLNIYSNRSYNDISQYPVFPWLLTNFEDPLQKKNEQNDVNSNNKNIDQAELIDYTYRDLSTPIGMLEIGEDGLKRKENFITTFEELKNEVEEFSGQKPYFYGSNYSNPIYTCNFLVRVFPFTHISIELQGDKLDNSNRLFYSIKNTFTTCTSLKTDVRELIPEFFYLPEMLLNVNDLELGKREDGSLVNHVFSPCNNDPYKFIGMMKNILENNKVSYNLQNWVDLIFGVKVRGKEAELARNIFSEASYQENIDLNKVGDKNTYLRMVEFGLIPNQIMNKECPKREKKEDIKKGKEITDLNAKLKIYKCKIKEEENSDNNICKIKESKPIVKTKLYNNDKIILFNGTNIIEKKVNFSSFDKSFSEETISNLSLGCNKCRMKYYYTNNKRQDKNIIICNQGKTVIIGGFYDGSVKILNFFKNVFKKLIPFKTEEPILSLAIDEEEKYLFVGNSIGNIIVYKISFDVFEWEIIINNTDQLSEISHININRNLNLWLSASIDGFVNIYTLPTFKLVRSIKTKSRKLEYAFLSTSNLPSIVIIDMHNKYRNIYSYSINGKFLKSEKEEDTLLNPIIIKDLNFNEYMLYICKNNNSVVIRNLPFLNIQTIIQDIDNISGICVSDDIKILYAISNNEEQIYAIKDDPKQAVIN